MFFNGRKTGNGSIVGGMERSRMYFPFIGLSYIDRVKKFVVRMPSSSLIFLSTEVRVNSSAHQPWTKATIGVTVVLDRTVWVELFTVRRAGFETPLSYQWRAQQSMSTVAFRAALFSETNKCIPFCHYEWNSTVTRQAVVSVKCRSRLQEVITQSTMSTTQISSVQLLQE